jgi:general secretion pathway protein D
MKNKILSTGLGILLAATTGFAADDAVPNTDATATAAVTNDAAPPPDQAPPPAPVAADDQTPQPAAETDQATAPAAPVTPAPTPAAAPAPTAPAPAVMAKPAPVPSNLLPNGKQGLRMNFRNAPLEEVLNYMSDAGGFIIRSKAGVDISGKVNVLSAQPVSKEEAVTLLKQTLNDNGYTAIQDGRILTIVRLTDAHVSDLPVEYGAEFEKIPKTADYRTQVVPVHTLNVVQLIKELDALKPTDTVLQADEAANAIIITGAQTSVRHLMEVVRALDGINSGSATVKVFKLKFADAKDLATHIKDLYPSTDNTTGAGARNPFARALGGRGGGGGGFGGAFGAFGGGAGGDTGADSNGHTPTAKVNATSDDQSNSLIVSAPDQLMDTITEIVNQLDVQVEDTTVVKIFTLRNADPVEMANLLTELFPDQSTTVGQSAAPALFRPFGFGGLGGGGGGRGNNAAPAESDRMKKLSHVGAVADPRTRSVVVTAGKDLMPDIEGMVAQLDASESGKMKVHVIALDNAEPIDIVTILTSMFPSSTTLGASASSLTSATANPLLNHAQTVLQQFNNSTVSSFGSGSGSGSRTGN